MAAVTGPATDNQVGLDILGQRVGVPGYNALTQSAELGEFVARNISLGRL